MWPDNLTKEQIRTMPKAVLHAHLNGCVSLTTWQRALRLRPVPPEWTDQLTPDGVVWKSPPSLNAFWYLYEQAQAHVLQFVPYEERLQGILQDAAQQGVRWLELLASPRAILGDTLPAAPAHLDSKTLFNLLVPRLRSTQVLALRHRVGVCLLLQCPVSAPEDMATTLRVAKLARDAGYPVAGVGAAGPHAPMAHVQHVLRKEGLSGLAWVPHAGELLDGNDLREALLEPQPTRVAHGIEAARDRPIAAWLASRQICCDVCPTSNIQLGAVPAGQPHPLAHMIRVGIPCSINPDDSLYLGTDVVQEYWRAQVELGLTATELVQCARASIAHSCAPDDFKARLLEDLLRWEDDVRASAVAASSATASIGTT